MVAEDGCLNTTFVALRCIYELQAFGLLQWT